ncbi:hypothetical protein BsWGS_13898 [Bradybaena similaris]
MPSVSHPKSVTHPSHWNEEVEEAYRFQQAGYRDETEYKEVRETDTVDRWPGNGYVKKLIGRDGCYYYYDKSRECPEAHINKTKLYTY